jgi:polyphenol oxidase
VRWALSRGWCRPRLPESWGFLLAASTRAAGNLRGPREFGRALKSLGLAASSWAGGDQVHGRRVRLARRPTAPGKFSGTDGVATDRAGLTLRVQAADCVPVLMADPVRRNAAAVHAGWRGVDKKILSEGVAKLRRLGSRPADLRVFLGPHIQACCYEVGPDVAERFRRVPGAVTARRGGRTFLDLARCLKHEARRAGVPPGRVWTAPYCTGHDRRFFSFRREKTDKRMAAVLTIL